MRALIQRVRSAEVLVHGQSKAKIGHGLLIFLGIGQADEAKELEKLWQKIWKLRIFEDAEGKSNLSLQDVQGAALIVSQFTLYAHCKKGNRPSFIEAAGASQGERLYEAFVARAKEDLADVQTGVFGAHMDVRISNDGPFTIWLDSDRL